MRKAPPARSPIPGRGWRCSRTPPPLRSKATPGFIATPSPAQQRALELDRFGLAAHVLASRDGCTADDCAAFALLRDTAALKANLQVHAFDAYVARYAAAWTKSDAKTEPKNEPKNEPMAEKKPGAPAAPVASAPVPSHDPALQPRKPFPLRRLDPAG